MKKTKLLMTTITLGVLAANAITIPLVTSSCGLVSTVTKPIEIKQAHLDQLQSSLNASNLSTNNFNSLLNNETNLIQAKRKIVSVIDPDGTKNIWPQMIGLINADKNGNIVISPAPGYSFIGDVNGNIILNGLISNQQSTINGFNEKLLTGICWDKTTDQQDFSSDLIFSKKDSSIWITSQNENFEFTLPTDISCLLLNNNQPVSNTNPINGYGNNLAISWNIKTIPKEMLFQNLTIKNSQKLEVNKEYHINLELNLLSSNTNIFSMDVNFIYQQKTMVLTSKEQLTNLGLITNDINANPIVINKLEGKENMILPDVVINDKGEEIPIKYTPDIFNNLYSDLSSEKIKSVEISKSAIELLGKPNNPFKFAENIKFGEGVSIIPNGLFINAPNLKSIIFPESLTKIDSSAFRYCSNLTNITLPKSLEIIGLQAFENCTNLTNITIEDNSNLKSIESDAFKNCTSLETFTFPPSIQRLEQFGKNENATPPPSNPDKNIYFPFDGCTKLKTIKGSAALKEQITNMYPDRFGENKIQWVII